MSATPDTTAPDTPTVDDPSSARSRPAPTGWAALRPLVLRIHFYAGVLVAPFLAVACLTGLVYVFSPQLSHVRGALDTWWDTTPLQTTLDSLHRNLLLGEPGRIYSELAASWLWVLVLGGLALWIGKRRGRRSVSTAVTPPLGTRPGRRRIMGWHGATGVWLAVALLFTSARG